MRSEKITIIQNRGVKNDSFPMEWWSSFLPSKQHHPKLSSRRSSSILSYPFPPFQTGPYRFGNRQSRQRLRAQSIQHFFKAFRAVKPLTQPTLWRPSSLHFPVSSGGRRTRTTPSPRRLPRTSWGSRPLAGQRRSSRARTSSSSVAGKEALARSLGSWERVPSCVIFWLGYRTWIRLAHLEWRLQPTRTVCRGFVLLMRVRVHLRPPMLELGIYPCCSCRLLLALLTSLSESFLALYKAHWTVCSSCEWIALASPEI
jgi:hypothetical protein